MIVVRAAQPKDCQVVAAMVCDLATIFGVVSETTPQSLQREAFGANPTIAILVAEDSSTQSLVGYVIHQDSFSTYRGSNGVFIVDLYVKPGQRSDGIGSMLLAEAARQGRKRGATFMRLDVEAGNDAAMRLYARLGFKEHYYHCYALDEPALSTLTAQLI